MLEFSNLPGAWTQLARTTPRSSLALGWPLEFLTDAFVMAMDLGEWAVRIDGM